MITLDDEIREMEHELARRRRVYDRLIAERKIFRSDADRTLAVLAFDRHPDRGGSDSMMADLNLARDQALREVGA